MIIKFLIFNINSGFLVQNFTVFRSVVFALFIRELKTRFGENRLGYVWIIAEPLVHIVMMMLIFSFIGATMTQVPFSLFLATGMIPFFLFKNIMNSVMNSIPANKALFSYRPVRPIAVYVTRSILETLIYGSVFICIIIGFMWFGIAEVSIAHPLEMVAILSMIILFGLAIGMLLSIATHKFPSIKMVINVIMTLLYFTSGIMYPLWIIPSEYLVYLEYNPLLHLIELFRESFFAYYPIIENISLLFPSVCIMLMGFIGLWFYNKREIYLKSST